MTDNEFLGCDISTSRENPEFHLFVFSVNGVFSYFFKIQILWRKQAKDKNIKNVL